MQRLANYELLRRLGSGGMAEVWMARKLAGERITKAVALKLLTQPRVDDERYRRMFLEEARLSMLLGHSNIVQVFDAGSEQGVAYLTMEWVDGVNLAQLQSLARERRLPIPDELVAHIIGELLQGLAYAHTVTLDGEPLGIIHRDVSPQNVLVSVSGEVKLADFGIARLAREETSGQFLKGKLRYMPPEQICGVSNAPTVDLYAVGAILHELLDGVRFREGDEDPAIYAQMTNFGIPPLRRSTVPTVLEALRRGLLEPDPERRIGTAIEAIELLRTYSGYRNETLVLGRLCRLCLGVKGPRSGVEENVASAAPAPIGTVFGAGHVHVVTPTPRTRWWPGVVVGAGLFAVVLGLRPQLLRDSIADIEAPAEAQAAGVVPEARAGEGAAVGTTTGAGDGTTSAGGAGRTAGSEAPAPPESSPPTPTPIADETAAVDPKPKTSRSSGPRASARAPAKVRFRVPGGQKQQFYYVRLRRRGGAEQEFVAEPRKDLELAPGSYTVEIRDRPANPWRGNKRIEVQGGREYEVRLTEAGIHMALQG
ncbi:MAG: serine/threonine protein kinase [Myxococcales bacterium]|nr:serine/threonine protein kinase [Myxococcales bacterium]